MKKMLNLSEKTEDLERSSENLERIKKIALEKAHKDFEKMNWTEGDGTTRQAATYIQHYYKKHLNRLLRKAGEIDGKY